MLSLYRALTFCLQPFLPWFLKRRVFKGKEDVTRLNERYGIASVPRPSGDLVWVHAASVGELLAVLPLIRMIKTPVLVTTMTKTGAEIAAKNGLMHQYIPLDTPQNAKRFLDFWQPSKVIFTEQELWINLIIGCQNIPLYLVNARFSAKSWAKWGRFPRTKAKVFEKFTTIFSQNPLGLENEIVVGNLKFDTPFTPFAVEKPQGFIWLAASTHKGEEEIMIEAHGEGLLILAPRHPERRDEIIKLLPDIKCKSKNEWFDASDRFYLNDTVGDMPLFYALADVAFMGKSLCAAGGQNPIEAIKAGCAILHGANVSNFQALYDELDRENGAICVSNVSDIRQALALNYDVMRAHASSIINRHKGALAKTFAGIFT
jgi:3-deoxy-D-manno-octulosonic-acid transferase